MVVALCAGQPRWTKGTTVKPIYKPIYYYPVTRIDGRPVRTVQCDCDIALDEWRYRAPVHRAIMFEPEKNWTPGRSDNEYWCPMTGQSISQEVLAKLHCSSPGPRGPLLRASEHLSREGSSVGCASLWICTRVHVSELKSSATRADSPGIGWEASSLPGK